jgi:putative membrane protein|tara:strand:+ start:327 stop:623 length:297 start_codon:yes stop_codon:yes gene_type:complete
MGRLFFLIFTSILIIISVVISTYNFQVTEINFYLQTYELPLSIIILYSFIAGVVTTSIYLIATIFSYKKKYREMKISLQNNQEELDNLRRNPLRDGTE